MSAAPPDAPLSETDSRRLRLRQAHQLLLRGVDQHQAGQWTAAMADYRRALGLDPENADALHLTGVALLQGGDNATAARWLAAATLARPGFATAWSNLGNALRATGQGNRAVACYRRALRLTPDFPDALNNLGSTLLAQNRPADAISCLIAALRLAPGLMEAGNNLADALKQQAAALEQAGDAAAAIGCYRRALALRPTDLAAVNQMVAALNNLGVALREREQLDEAAACYGDILRLAPGVTEARYNLALTRIRQGRDEDAAWQLCEILRQRPDANDARLALAGCLTALGRSAAATGHYLVALCFDPAEATALNAVGLARQGENRLAAAMMCWRRALRLSPDDPGILSNMGLGLHDSGDPAAAAGYFDRAVAQDPDHVPARWNGAVNRLLLGDYDNGWREYEWRWRLADTGGRIGAAIAPWDGGDAGGRTILLECEQGLGDCLHFIRYAPLVRARNARVAVLCPPALRRIFASVAGIDHLGCRLDELPPCDVRAPLLSLPRLLGTTLATVPAATIPYLDVEPERAVYWRDRLAHVCAQGRGRRIGLVWRGGGGYRNDVNRSMPAALLAGLLDAPGVWGVSLQKDAPDEDRAAFAGRHNFTDLSRELADFADTAAVIRQLDLVVSVDTSVLHLAGGLGAPAWGLLPFVPDWRWGRDGAASPWYPAIRLFRQPARGDWGSVIAAVAAALAVGE